MRERMRGLIVGGEGVKFGMGDKLGKEKGTLQRVWGDVLKVMEVLYGKRVMAGSEAQVLVDEAYAAKY